MGQFNIDKNKYDEALRKSCNKKIKEEKELQIKVTDVTSTLQKLYKEKDEVINAIKKSKSELLQVQLQLKDAKNVIESYKEYEKITNAGLQKDKEVFEKRKEDFDKDYIEKVDNLLQIEKNIDDKQVALDDNTARNKEILEDIKAVKDLLPLEKGKINIEKDALANLQNEFVDDKRKFNENKEKFNQEKEDFKIEKEDLIGREEKYNRDYAILEMRENNAQETVRKQYDKQIRLDLQETEIEKLRQRIDNLIEIHNLRGK